MDFLYDSYLMKKPFGAATAGEQISIDFPIKQSVPVESARIIIRKYHEEAEYLSVPLDFYTSNDGYNYYKGSFTLPAVGIYFYRFEVKCPDGIWFIGRDKLGRAIRRDFASEWQITVYDRDFKTPDFIKGGIIYHIFVDRFNKSGKVNFKKKGVLKSWDMDVDIHAPDGTYTPDDFFGGNFKGIIDKLDYLSSLNVTLIYLSPIFESSSNHRYDTGDYMKIDELLGTEEDFRELIQEAAKRGMGIMLDGVFNHAGADSIYFNKFNNYPTLGAYQSKASAYYDWFTFTKHPDEYECWWGITAVPTINKTNRGYQKLLLGKGGILDKWTKFDIAGWRLDVVDELPEFLVDRIRAVIKNINPDVLIVGEVWEDASVKVSYGTLRPYLTGNQLDSVMNYPFREAVIRYLSGGVTEKFIESVMMIVEHYPKQVLDCMMNLLSTHDTVRILNVFSGLYSPIKSERQQIVIQGEALEKARKKLIMAASILYMLPGVPSIYYGDEVGLQGYEDPMNRRPFPWGREDKEILAHFIRLGQIRREKKEIMLGGIRFYNHPDLLIFTRETKAETIAVFSNVSGKKQVWTNTAKGVNLLNRQIIDEGPVSIDNLETIIIAY